MKATIIDYGRGNLFSLCRALDQIGTKFALTEEPDEVRKAEALILPGVGAFGDAMAGLSERKLVEPIREAAERGTPLLGICLGMQILMTRGEEFGAHEGLGLVPGSVLRLPEKTSEAGAIRIPNVGWRKLHITAGDACFGNLIAGAMFYFVHSYAPVAENPEHVVATIPVNGSDIAAIIRCNRVVGCQFHPEKSGPEGLNFLRQFITIAAEKRRAA